MVYRVLDLPPSMRPLVYDFGQLNDDTEKDYTFQIVNDRCNDIDEVKGQTNVIQSVAHVLAWSQKYMRERNVNYCCKIVLISYFYRMNVALLA